MLTTIFLTLLTFASIQPELPPSSKNLQKTAISISYNSKHKQADWVFYKLSKNELRNCVNRGNNFRPDPSVKKGPQLEDYKDSGYDRGHLSPAGDNKWSERAMNDSFLLTNISPQPNRFNEGIWARLETLVRAWALIEPIWVVTGPELHPDLETIGDSRISVPEAFYKVILTESGKGIGFYLPTDARGTLDEYAVTIDEVEEHTGLNFFPGIKNEEAIESHLDLDEWNFKAKFSYLPCR